MLQPNKTVFLTIWPRCFITFMGLIELICTIMFFLTELCSVAANFWTTNVFAGGWCGLIMLIHVIALFVAGTCAAGPPAAFRAAIITIFALLACAVLVSFDIAFIVQPTICILTPSCTTNAASNTTFTYSFRQSFFTVFNGMSIFKSYTESQVKLLCQAIQLGLAAVCVIDCIIYLIIYFECLRRLNKQRQIAPVQSPNPQDYNELQESTISPMPTKQPNYGLPPSTYTPQQVYPTYPSPPSQQVYAVPPPPLQQVYTVPPPPSQQVYVGLPPPQGAYYAPPPPPLQQPMYYVAPPPQQFIQPSVPAWGPRPNLPQAQPGAVPWYANNNT